MTSQRIQSRPRGRSYIHPSKRTHTSTAVGVTSILDNDHAEGARCAICCLSTAEMYRYKRNADMTQGKVVPPETGQLKHHFCVRCQSIMCDVCGDLLRQLVKRLPDAQRRRFGCVLDSCRGEATRRHEYCPCCHPELQDLFEGPFREYLKDAATQGVIYIEEADDGFLLVDLRALPVRDAPNGRHRGRSLRGQQMLAADSDMAPLMTLAERRAKKQNLIDFLNAADDDDRSTAIAEKWFQLGEQLRSLERISIKDKSLSKCDCYARAVAIEPDTLLFSQALLSHMSKKHVVEIRSEKGAGQSFDRLGIAARVVRLDPTIVESWRNLAFVMGRDDRFSLDPDDTASKQYDRNDALRMSVTLCEDDTESQYLAAFHMQPQTMLVPVPGKGELCRTELFAKLLDEANEGEELDELIDRKFGKRCLVLYCSEIALLLPDHPLVQRYQAQYVFDESKDVLGVGAFGTVHVGQRRQPNRHGQEPISTPFAVKILRAQLKDPSIASIPELCLLTSPYFTETMAAAYFVKYDHRRGRAFAYMQLAEHGSTFQYMKNHVKGRLHETEIRAVLLQALTSLRLLHYHGVIHQDIKPANILIFDNFEVRLADFGVTAMTFCEIMKVEVAGTEVYMPPEAYNDSKITAAGDIWSLAVTLVELGSFTHPVPDPKRVRDANARHPFRPYIPDHFSSELKAILNKMLDYDYVQRPSAEELLQSSYFMSDPVMESRAMYLDNKTHHGIPQAVLNLEDLSTMGYDTRMMTTMMRTTMALKTIKLQKGIVEPTVTDSTPTAPSAPVTAPQVETPLTVSSREEHPTMENGAVPVAPPSPTLATTTDEAANKGEEVTTNSFGKPPIAPAAVVEGSSFAGDVICPVMRKHSLSPVPVCMHALEGEVGAIPIPEEPEQPTAADDSHHSSAHCSSTSDDDEEELQFEVEEVDIE